jgi:hypothetical protein
MPLMATVHMTPSTKDLHLFRRLLLLLLLLLVLKRSLTATPPHQRPGNSMLLAHFRRQ